VEYGLTQDLGTRRDTAVYGLRTANVTEHRVVLEGLRPGTNYWYRVAFKPIRKFAASKVEFGPEQQSEPAAFQTLPAPGQKVTALIFNDLHNGTNLFQQLRRAAGDAPFDFSIFNGDCFADPGTEPPVLALLSAYTQGVQANRRPAFFLRGNHETRGAYARPLPHLLGWPGDKPYFAFTAGPVRFVVLDCGEDKPDEHPAYSGLVDFNGFRREETEWLKAEAASREYRKAAWRVLVHHIPLYRTLSAEAATNRPPPWQQEWTGLLRKADLAICGHTHVRAFHAAGSVGNPYPVVIGGGPKTNTATVMILEADRRHLKLRVLDAKANEVFPIYEKAR
jgi:phosphodiesterase/alkaline phosphatase D-like protein